jgi:hypothetical protein
LAAAGFASSSSRQLRRRRTGSLEQGHRSCLTKRPSALSGLPFQSGRQTNFRIIQPAIPEAIRGNDVGNQRQLNAIIYCIAATDWTALAPAAAHLPSVPSV